MNEDDVMEILERFKSVEKETVRLVYEIAEEKEMQLSVLLPFFAETFCRHVKLLYKETEEENNA